MEEYSAEETVITAVSQNDDQSVETTVIMEEHIVVDQTETVNQPTLQQYSKYHIDMSQTFELLLARYTTKKVLNIHSLAFLLCSA
jgi:hypothetical protein